MKILVTGGAGFIGSHITDALLARGHFVTVIDNLSGGRKEFIKHNLNNPRFCFVECDLSDKAVLHQLLSECEEVWHIAAKPDVRTYDIEDFKNDIDSTSNLLEAMRCNGVKRLVYSSSSTVYGEADVIPTPENARLCPISVYGASKVACEALIQSYSANFGIRSFIFRFANVVGERCTHGVITDFVTKLKNNSRELEILGDGTQSKSYLCVQDCVNGMLRGTESNSKGVDIFNLGCDDWISVTKIAEIVSSEMGTKPNFIFTGGKRGWTGDVPKMLLSIEKIKSLGWNPGMDSAGAVRNAAKATISALC